jgi:uncharacterized protein
VLYLDTSALVKHYVQEAGTEQIQARLEGEAEHGRSVFTSVLTYAEIHAVLARRLREKFVSADDFEVIRDRFDADWNFDLAPVELSSQVLRFVRDAVRGFSLKGADGVHLASALWLRDASRAKGTGGKYAGPVVFVSSDRQLTRAAAKSQFEVFNPESAS